MENTGLRELDPFFLRPTGLYRLEISKNPLYRIPNEAFIGLERSLSKVILTDNKITEIPYQAIRHLRKLQHLDLSGNYISDIKTDAWRGLEDSIENIILAENLITSLPIDSFSSLTFLTSLDLTGNNIKKIDKDVFRDGMVKLENLILADNLLDKIPYVEISPLKALKQLDLSFNQIIDFIEMNSDEKNIKLNINVLRLDHNQISMLRPRSFQFFDVANITYLDGNPIISISEGAFQKAKIQELYIRNCKISTIIPEAFSGLEGSLQILDLSGNNITNFPEKTLSTFDNLKAINLRENKIKNLMSMEMLTAIQPSLQKLDITGNEMGFIKLQNLRKLKNLRALAVSNINAQNLVPEDFLEFGYELEILKLYKAGIRIVKNNAFREIRSIKRLDLSENRIETIELDAFKELGSSLLSLKISHGCSMDMIAPSTFKHLKSLEELDLSNNQLTKIPETSFHFLSNLRLLNLHDNKIEGILKGTFQAEYHHHLKFISLAFNNIRQIQQYTFVDLRSLIEISLKDNKIERIERKSFMNMDKLKVINLRGNKINTIINEAFQNLPNLETLDLAFNSLKDFDFDYLDQVGSLAILRVNVSHNKLRELTNNVTISARDHGGSFYHCNVKWLDLSYNNISNIYGGFFRPTEMSLSHLIMNNNAMKRIFKDTFGNLHHLQFLDLSNNMITDIDSEAFRNIKRLQIIKLHNNWITELPADLFRFSRSIRIADLSNNLLRQLHENFFAGDRLEDLNLGFNLLSKIPALSMSNLAALTLSRLDLSHNQIGNIQSIDLSNKFRSLSWLDLSYNQLVRLEDAAFATLPRLNYLDLSYNVDLEISPRAFIGLENTLIELHLQNISLDVAPEISLQKLQHLSLAFNELPNIPPQFSENLTSLQILDLSYNELTIIPEMIKYLQNLRSLSLAGNPITSLTNVSLGGIAKHLKELNIANLNLNEIESEIFTHHLPYIRTLHFSSYPNIPKFNIPALLQGSQNLRKLVIHGNFVKTLTSGSSIATGGLSTGIVDFIGYPTASARQGVNKIETDFRSELDGQYPFKVRKIKFVGSSITRISESILRGVRSAVLDLVFENTSIISLPDQLFKNLEYVRNISLDLSNNNPMLSKIPNPNSAHYPMQPKMLHLTNIDIAGLSLTCNCELGWIEFWGRKKRQNCGPSQEWSENTFSSPNKPLYSRKNQNELLCNNDDGDLRTAKCENKNQESLVEILKTDLECGWGSSAPLAKVGVWLIFSTTFVTFLF